MRSLVFGVRLTTPLSQALALSELEGTEESIVKEMMKSSAKEVRS